MKFVPTDRLAGLIALVGILMLGAMAVVSITPLVAMAIAASVVGVVALVDAVGSRMHSKLTVGRRHPPVIALGASADLTWELRSSASRSMRVLIADPLAPSLNADTRRIAVTIPSASIVTASTRVHPERRGRFEIDHMTVRILGPLGLMAAQRVVPLATTLRVHPRFRSKDEAELRIKKARFLEVGTRSAQGLGGGTDFDQMKDYLPDDEYRRIDWVTTARVGRPVVRSYRAEKNQHVMVLLDNGRVQAGLVDGVPRVEHSMDAAMMLTTLATGLGDHCGLVGFDSQIRSVLSPARRRDQVTQVAEAMYSLEPELAESDYAGAFAYALSRFRRRMLVVVLTDIVDQSIDAALIPALPVLLRKHIVVVAAVADPKLLRWAQADSFVPNFDDSRSIPGSFDDLTAEERINRRIAALDALATRQRTVARLRGMGVIVVDAEPRTFASKLGDVYLGVKSTGRL